MAHSRHWGIWGISEHSGHLWEGFWGFPRGAQIWGFPRDFWRFQRGFGAVPWHFGVVPEDLGSVQGVLGLFPRSLGGSGKDLGLSEGSETFSSIWASSKKDFGFFKVLWEVLERVLQISEEIGAI